MQQKKSTCVDQHFDEEEKEEEEEVNQTERDRNENTSLVYMEPLEQKYELGAKKKKGNRKKKQS